MTSSYPKGEYTDAMGTRTYNLPMKRQFILYLRKATDWPEKSGVTATDSPKTSTCLHDLLKSKGCHGRPNFRVHTICQKQKAIDQRNLTQVVDEWCHSSRSSKEGAISWPFAAVAHGLCQLGPQGVVVCVGKLGQFLNHSMICYDSKILLIPLDRKKQRIS